MLNNETLDVLRREAENAGVTKMMLFGSCLEKTEDEANDIDIAVAGLKKNALYQFVGGLLLSDELKKQIDVIDLSDNIPFVRLIAKKGVVIYEQGL